MIKWLLPILFAPMMAFAQNQRIDQLPLISASTTGATDSLPYLNVSTNKTSRINLSDLLNIPTLQSKFITMIPNQSGHSGQYLRTNGTTTSWAAVAGSGTVTSVALSVPAFLSVAGSPITTSGTFAISLSGTALPIANGGTGQTSANSAFNALAPSQTLHTGECLTTNGSNTSWAACAGASGADTALSNLTNPTAINQDLIPGGSTHTRSIGSATKSYDEIYVRTVVDANLFKALDVTNHSLNDDSGQVVFNFSGTPTHKIGVNASRTVFDIDSGTLSDPASGGVVKIIWGNGLNTTTTNVQIAGGIDFRLNGSTSGYTGIKSAAVGPSIVYTLPAADGTGGQFLKTNGAGVLSFGTPVITPGTVCGWSDGTLTLNCDGLDPASSCPTGYTQKTTATGAKLCAAN